MTGIKPEVAAYIDEKMKHSFVMTPISMREGSIQMCLEQRCPKVPMANVIDTVMSQCGEYNVPVRVYVPHTETMLPVLVYYHGGGFVVDSVAMYDTICRRIAAATNHIVIAPEYRLAPENPYPAAEVDAIAVAKRALPTLTYLGVAHTNDVTLCGDSAGGYLAAKTALALQDDAAVPLTHQILVYPCLDMTCSYPSIAENCNAKTGFLAEKLRWYFWNYFPLQVDRKGVSPLFHPITPSLVPTLVITAQYCPFRDEGTAYVERLRAQGIRAEQYNYENMVHSYLNFEQICDDEICDTYKRMKTFLQA